MRIEHEWSYEAPAEQVYAMIIDPAFQEAKCRHAAAVSFSADVTRVDGHDEVLVHRSMSTADLPSQLRSLIGETIDIVERQVWQAEADDQGGRTADLRVEIKAAPVAFTGRITMTPDSGHTRLRAKGDLVAKIPLVGGRIEEAARPAITGAIDIEQETGREFLTT